MAAKTQLHSGSLSGRRYGSFAGKPAGGGGGGGTGHPVKKITQLHSGCFSGRRYGSFANKAPAATGGVGDFEDTVAPLKLALDRQQLARIYGDPQRNADLALVLLLLTEDEL